MQETRHQQIEMQTDIVINSRSKRTKLKSPSFTNETLFVNKYKKLAHLMIKEANKHIYKLLDFNIDNSTLKNAFGDVILIYKDKKPIFRFDGYTGWVDYEMQSHGVVPDDYNERIKSFLNKKSTTLEKLIDKFNHMLTTLKKIREQTLRSVKLKYNKEINRLSKEVSENLLKDNSNILSLGFKTKQAEQQANNKAIDYFKRFYIKIVDKYFDEVEGGLVRQGVVDKQNIVETSRDKTSEFIDLDYRTSNTYVNHIITKDKFIDTDVKKIIWRSMEDGRVRSTHRKWNGKMFRMDALPKGANGNRVFPGEEWGCRCFAEPVFD